MTALFLPMMGLFITELTGWDALNWRWWATVMPLMVFVMATR